MPQSCVLPIHTQVGGRARLHVAGLYRSDRLKHAIESALRRLPGIHAVSASVLTGNVLVLFDPKLSLKAVVGAVMRPVVSAAAGKVTCSSSAEADSAPRGAVISASAARTLRAMVRQGEAPPVRPWHLLPTDTVVDELHTSRYSGLSSAAAKAALVRFGPNVLPEAVPRSSFAIFLGQFNSLPVWLLGASAVVSVATGSIADAAVILGVVLINATIGFFTERQAERTISSLTHTVQTGTLVLRDGEPREIRPEQVVPGDLLLLSPGRYVSSDARVIEARNLSIDESALTGESLPVFKLPEVLQRADVPLGDRNNMAYMGTLVTGGSGRAVVTATGRHTEIGTIQALVGETRSPDTPMQKQLNRMGNQMVVLSGAICAGVAAVGLLRGYGWLEMLKSATSLAVAAVPEGLPTVATTTLALGIADMRRHKVLIRHLEAVETLGSVQVICLDKTGTITRNRMSVAAVHVGLARLEARDGGLYAGDAEVNPFSSAELLRLLHVAALCNECELNGKAGAWVVQGTPTEAALLELAVGAGIDVVELRRRHPRQRVQYRAENRLFMSTLHAAEGNRRLVAVKGSPPEVLAMCTWHMKGARKRRLSEEQRQAIIMENERMAGRALRVLGLAYALGDDEAPEARDGLIWLGLVGMADPVREGVGRLIRTFHRAGIETVMITGDQSATAYAIGRELGLSGDAKPLDILDTTHLEQLQPEVLTALAQHVNVFARVSPAQKLQIVQALQRAGRVVAMTGDGINDGPALKTADIGVAMGDSGTDVARTVADVVLEDDNLQTMIVAVSRGRTTYNNIRKSIHYLLSTNLSEIEVMLLSIAAGMGQPLNPMQLLWINLISDIFPALALAVEPPEPDVLSQPPRDPSEPIITPDELRRVALESTAITAGTMAAYGVGIARYGPGPSASTMAFTTLTVSQIIHALSCRSRHIGIFSATHLPSNRYLTLATGGALALQGATLAIPGLRALLGLGTMGLADAAVTACGAALPFILSEATKRPPAAFPATVVAKVSESGPSLDGRLTT